MSNLGDFPIIQARSSANLRSTTISPDGKLIISRTYSTSDLSNSASLRRNTHYKPRPFRYNYDPSAFYITNPDNAYDRSRYFKNYILNGYLPYSNRYDNYPYERYGYQSRSGGYTHPYGRTFLDENHRSNQRNIQYGSTESYWPTYHVFRGGYYSRYGTVIFN